MKKLFLLITVFVSVCLPGGFAGAMDCSEGNAMLDKAFAATPDEMTAQYVEMAVQTCPDNADLLKRIGEYYEKSYKEELNPEKQAEYKRLAEDYYQKALETKDGGGSEEIKTMLASLKGSKEFNEVSFRALRPAAKGATGSGLKLEVNFDRGSYELSDTAQKHLDVLGRILAEQPSITVSLEGHTDMTGTAKFNKDLSVKRADSAKKYLVDKYDIDTSRIQTAGFGFERLADKKDPYSAVNRRVEVIKLSE